MWRVARATRNATQWHYAFIVLFQMLLCFRKKTLVDFMAFMVLGVGAAAAFLAFFRRRAPSNAGTETVFMAFMDFDMVK